MPPNYQNLRVVDINFSPREVSFQMKERYQEVSDPVVETTTASDNDIGWRQALGGTKEAVYTR